MWRIVFLCSFVIFILSIILYGIRPSSIVESPDEEYDYIVVGAGTAGCVLASRLSEDPKLKVLLVEAGNTIKFISRIPLLAPVSQLTSSDWQYRTVTQKFSSKGLIDNVQFLPRGKGLGGTGAINYLLHSYGQPSDFNDWPSGWNYPDLTTNFAEVEKLLSINRRFTSNVLSRAAELYRRTNLSYEQIPITTYEGVRTSSYRSHLRKAWDRGNLHILKDKIVSRVLIDDRNTARGIEYVDADVNETDHDESRKVKARREIVVCAGAMGSPQLLMLSGVGPEKELIKHKITMKKHLPNVGRNYFDHLNMPMYVKLKNPPPLPVSVTHGNLLTLGTLIDYLFGGAGLLASNGIVGVTRQNDHAVILTAIGTTDKDTLMQLSNYKNEIFESLFPTHNDTESQGFLMLSTCLQPKSRGRLTLESSDPRARPLIDPNYLSKTEDVRCHVKAMQQVKKIAESPSFVEHDAELHLPRLDECRHYRRDIDDEEFSGCLARIAAITSHHPGGTCRMGYDEKSSVVDEKLRVHDIGKLRIIDASVLPSPISGPPNSVIVAMAEKAAKMIKETA